MIWVLVEYAGNVSLALFGKVGLASEEALEINARSVLEKPLGEKTFVHISLVNSAFSFSDWRELPEEISQWTKKGFEGVLLIAPGEDMTCGLWASKASESESS